MLHIMDGSVYMETWDNQIVRSQYTHSELELTLNLPEGWLILLVAETVLYGNDIIIVIAPQSSVRGTYNEIGDVGKFIIHYKGNSSVSRVYNIRHRHFTYGIDGSSIDIDNVIDCSPKKRLASQIFFPNNNSRLLGKIYYIHKKIPIKSSA